MPATLPAAQIPVELVNVLRTIVREEVAAAPRAPHVWLREREAERYLGMKSQTLANRRRLGQPAPASHGERKLRRYHIDDLNAFVRAGFTDPKAAA
jgi:hypothetical protein